MPAGAVQRVHKPPADAVATVVTLSVVALVLACRLQTSSQFIGHRGPVSGEEFPFEHDVRRVPNSVIVILHTRIDGEEWLLRGRQSRSGYGLENGREALGNGLGRFAFIVRLSDLLNAAFDDLSPQGHEGMRSSGGLPTCGSQ